MREAHSRASVLGLATLLMVMCQGLLVSAQQRMVVRATAAGTLAVESVEGTRLFGAGVTVDVTDIVQVFGDGMLEMGHPYPPDSPRRPAGQGPPVQLVLVLPHRRIDRLLVAGLRASVPPDHRVRPFVELGAGLARERNADVILTVPQQTRYSSRRDWLIAAGGGISTSVSKRLLFDIGYRWHQLSPDSLRHSLSALNASVGVLF